MLLRRQMHLINPPSWLGLVVDKLQKKQDSVNHFCILEIIKAVDNYLAKKPLQLRQKIMTRREKQKPAYAKNRQTYIK